MQMEDHYSLVNLILVLKISCSDEKYIFKVC